MKTASSSEAPSLDYALRAASSLLARLLLALAAVQGIAQAAAADPQRQERPAGQPLVEVAAFGAAPVSRLEGAGRSLPQAGDYLLRPEAAPPGRTPSREIEIRAASGETWLDLFSRVQRSLESETLARAAAIDGIALLPPLVAGKYVRLRALEQTRTVEIDYVVNAEEGYAIVLHPAGVQVKRHAGDAKLAERIRSDPAKASLFTASDAIGLPEGIVLQLVEIFAGDVDFHRELHQGYRCTIAYEVVYRDGHIDPSGKILAVDMVVHKRRLQAFYFDDGRGGGYYAETGRSMKKVFRRSPVEFSRVTSDYTLARFHPILGLWRAHRGVDYAAPLGARVLATADGTVDYVGERGELGNLVILQHQDRFLTYYGHLNAFPPGLAAGNKVQSGQVIGYVGMTGLATGPHLHYEFRVRNGAGEWISVPAPDEVEAPPVASPAFLQVVQSYRDQLQVAANAHFVILD